MSNDITAQPSRPEIERVMFRAAAILLLLASCAAVAFQIDRSLDHDEGEYIHAAWLMSEGKRIYRDFMEDHPPFLYQALNVLRPDGQSTPGKPRVYQWAVRGRIASALCGTIAMLAAALTVWRITGSSAAFLVTFASLVGANWTWIRALAEIRADAPTIALFMAGVLLVIWDEVPSMRMAWLCGFGIALAIGAEIWNPKWPLEGACLGIFFLVQLARLVRARRTFAIPAILPSIGVGAIAAFVLTRATTVRDYLFFNFILKSQNLGGLETQAWISAWFRRYELLYFAPRRFAGIGTVIVFAVVVLLLVSRWRTMEPGAVRRWLLLLAMAVTSAIEVRFIYPWPNLWAQFFVMLAFTMAMMFGLAAAGIAEWRPAKHAREAAFAIVAGSCILGIWFVVQTFTLIEASAAARVLLVAAGALCVAPLAIVLPRVRRGEASIPIALGAIPIAMLLAVPSLAEKVSQKLAWPGSATWAGLLNLEQRLRPGDTVWVTSSRHPLLTPDDSYFWYSFPDLVPMTLDRIARNPQIREYLPPLGERDLPICRLARGEAPHLRLVEIGPYAFYMPEACRCSQAVLSRPDVVPTVVPPIYQVLRKGERASGPTPSWDAVLRPWLMQCRTE